MKRIGLVANTDWYLYNFRLGLARYLRASGFEVRLISPAGKYTASFKQENFPWIEWQIGRQSLMPWEELSALRRLARLYRDQDLDLIHQHTIKPVIYGSLAARMLGNHSVINSITGRGYVFLSQEPKAFVLRPAVRLLYRMAFRDPKYAAIFENDEDRSYFIANRLISADRTWLIPGVGVDTQRYQPCPAPAGQLTVLFASRMLWDKGVGTLVDAARILKINNSVKVVLVGEPDPGNPASIAPEQLSTWTAEGVVEWWGWQADMSQIYRQVHIVTLPTQYGEGVPTVLLEAAACGLPIVASDIPGCRAIIQHEENGLLVPPGDARALARALQRLISDSDLRGRMGQIGRQIVLNKFALDLINQSTFDVYQDVLAHSKI
jgi:glycosyltransferase involved in cell wall biosynthesis